MLSVGLSVRTVGGSAFLSLRREGENVDLVEEVLAVLAQKLPALIRSGQGWQIEIHGKGGSVQIKVSDTTLLQSKVKLLEECR